RREAQERRIRGGRRVQQRAAAEGGLQRRAHAAVARRGAVEPVRLHGGRDDLRRDAVVGREEVRDVGGRVLVRQQRAGASEGDARVGEDDAGHVIALAAPGGGRAHRVQVAARGGFREGEIVARGGDQVR